MRRKRFQFYPPKRAFLSCDARRSSAAGTSFRGPCGAAAKSHGRDPAAPGSEYNRAESLYEKKSDKHPTYDLETEEETPNKAEEKAHEHHEKENRNENKQENQSEGKQEPKKKPRYAETMLRNNLYQISHPAENSRKRHKKKRVRCGLPFLNEHVFG